ncbi:MAG: MFS transporter [Proteobacteria bacterium]|nr:MFS transporter [Pseudomonadota bacterium]
MSKRWLVLAVLAFARIAMGFQFQAVASVSPFLVEEFGIDYASIGTLIGLYLLPGVVLALPGGWLGRRFGEKRMVLGGLALMAVGGAVSAYGASYAILVTGRVLTGVGVVLQFVLMTKMLADWFKGKELVFAVSLYLNGWPIGIGLALVTQVGLAAAYSWRTVFLATAVFCAFTFVVLALLYRSPPAPKAAMADASDSRLTLREILMVSFAGLIWTFVNAGWVITVSFSPGYLRSQGVELNEAATVTSLATWLGVIGLPLGGWLASRLGRPNAFIVASMAIGGLAVLAVPFTSAYALCFSVIGLIIFLPAGIMAALPIEVLRPESRAMGLGLFYTWWYAGMAALPPLGGWSYDVTGNPAAPILCAAAFVFMTLVALVCFRLCQRMPAGRSA